MMLLAYFIGIAMGVNLGWQLKRWRVLVRQRDIARIESARRQHETDEGFMRALESWRK